MNTKQCIRTMDTMSTIDDSFCTGGNAWAVTGRIERCPVCKRRLQPYIVWDWNQPIGFKLPPHKPKGYRIPNKIKNKER